MLTLRTTAVSWNRLRLCFALLYTMSPWLHPVNLWITLILEKTFRCDVCQVRYICYRVCFWAVGCWGFPWCHEICVRAAGGINQYTKLHQPISCCCRTHSSLSPQLNIFVLYKSLFEKPCTIVYSYLFKTYSIKYLYVHFMDSINTVV